MYQSESQWQAHRPRVSSSTGAEPSLLRPRATGLYHRAMSVIVRVAVPRPLWTPFDYLLPPDVSPPQPGARVRVPFGATELVGLAVETACVDAVDTELKSILEVIDRQPVLQADIFELIRWAAAYYRHPLGDALFSAVPVALRDGRALQPLRERFWQLGRDRRRSGRLVEARAPAARRDRSAAHRRRTRQPRGRWSRAGVDARVLSGLVKKGIVTAASAPANHDRRGHEARVRADGRTTLRPSSSRARRSGASNACCSTA